MPLLLLILLLVLVLVLLLLLPTTKSRGARGGRALVDRGNARAPLGKGVFLGVRG
jgi:preprotein translocase subunit SecG